MRIVKTGAGGFMFLSSGKEDCGERIAVDSCHTILSKDLKMHNTCHHIVQSTKTAVAGTVQ
jgi:hypothetical protein